MSMHKQEFLLFKQASEFLKSLLKKLLINVNVKLFRYTPQIPRTLRSSAILDRRSSAAPDQSYRLFRYTPQIPRTLRSSAILDRRSSAATPINHIDYSVTLHRFYVRSDPRPFSIADPRPLRTRVYSSAPKLHRKKLRYQ
ncbi:uncharacterized protein BDCG_16326 [Blastomyces dermatitidis ER-3]|uniref:Uncharacterized protein n=1 Tax=Ajellomyces dermatitidis (strain ER-3 / ATCC MYA-2586) TaxID=559297 RepID=A0ABX2VRF3_AJEDR|nr:uncharacterized protein BDCG_16326 [Blastomyces dermatitidis ER-3]OAS99811.1 hypothetical protein BDCG_16326 [Blastomyces dermatitidis ER-3]